MSQIYKSLASGPTPPSFLTGIITDSQDANVTAISQPNPQTVSATANKIQLNGDNGIITYQLPNLVGSTNVVQVAFQRGNGQTVGAATTTLLSLGTSTDTAFTLQILFCGFSDNNLGIGGYALASFINVAGVLTLVDILDYLLNTDPSLAASAINISASGTNVVISATGVLGRTINWGVCTPGIVIIGKP